MNYVLKKLSIISLLSLIGITLLSCNNEVKIDVFDFHTEDQRNFLASENPNNFTLYAKAKEEKSASNPIHIDLDSINDGDIITVINENNNKIIYQATSEKALDLYNLELNTKYIINVNSEEKCTFKTVDAGLRNLNIDGVVNARDIGGWHDIAGNMLNQGLIYRSARLSEDETGVTTITEAGINTMVNTLGIKSEIDLRTLEDSGGITKSPLGDEVNYYAIPMNSGGNIIVLNKEIIKDFFEILGDKFNYPLVIHCSIGTDRTGCMAVILEALLGMSETDILRDYLFSNFSKLSRMRTSSIVYDYLKLFKASDGKDLSEQTYNYLVSIGVDSADLDTVIELMK